MASSSSSNFNSIFNLDQLEIALADFRGQWMAAKFTLDAEWYHTLGNSILQLEHWSYLRGILTYIHKCFNDAATAQNLELERLVIKIEAASDKIAKELEIANAKNFILERPENAFYVLRQLEMDIEIFKPEIGQVLHHLFSVSSLEFHSSLDVDHISHLDRSLRSVHGILRYIWAFVDEDQEEQIHALQTKVSSLHSFILQVLDFEFGSHSVPVIVNFFNHVASLAVRMAYQSYHYWIKATDETMAQIRTTFGLLSLQREIDPTTPEFLESNLKCLQHEIDPTTPEFWELILKFVTSMNKITGGRNTRLAYYFLRYVIHWESDIDIFPILESLVTFVINEPEESSEDVLSLRAEIKVFLLIAGSPTTTLEELFSGVCLLKVEVFVKEQLTSSSTTFLKEQSKIKDLTEVLNLIRHFSKDPQQENIEDDQNLVLVQDVTKKVEYLYQSFHAKRVTEEAARVSLFYSLMEIVFTKAESYASVFLENDASLKAFGKNEFETINQGLELFDAFIRSQRIETTKDIKPIIKHFEAAAGRVTSLYYSCLMEQTTEEMIQKRITLLSNLLDKMKLIKSDLRKMLPRYQRSNFPKTGGMAYVDFLLCNIRELQKHDPKSIALVKDHIEGILLDLEFFRSFFIKILEQDIQQSELNDLDDM